MLALAGLPLLSAVAIPAAAFVETGATKPLSVIEALEAHGQWATNPLWAFNIHSALGSRSVTFGYAEASGPQRVQQATQLALEQVQQHAIRASGAVLVVMAQPGVTLLREAKQALNQVRDALPLDTYGVFSPLASDEYGQEIGVSLSLGW